MATATFDDYLQAHARAAFLHGPLLRTEVLSRLPALLARMAACKALRVRHAEEGLYVPTIMFLAVTGACNYRCSYCYTSEYGPRHMPVPLARRILSQAYDLGVSLVVVTGGEPLLHRDFFSIPPATPDMPFIVFSNGVLVPQFLADGLASENLLWAISVDGPQDVCDARRGKGSFDAACRAMDALREHGAVFGFSATVAGENVAAAVSPEFMALMAEKGCHSGFVLEQIPAPACDPPLGEQIARRLAECRRAGSLPLVGFPTDEVEYGGCQAGGRGLLHISPEGAVEPCPAAHIAADSLDRVSLRDALSSPFLAEFRRHGEEAQAGPACQFAESDDDFREALAGLDARPTV
jgi:MoaA/NifB/PqqE/SkfB family radical SAM enzyme